MVTNSRIFINNMEFYWLELDRCLLLLTGAK